MSGTHGRRSGDAPEPLYDVNVPTPTHAERARTLVASISTGTLCTIALEPAGYPYGSFVTVAFEKGDPDLPHQRRRRTHEEPGAGSPRVAAGRRERRRRSARQRPRHDARSVHARRGRRRRRPRRVPGRASELGLLRGLSRLRILDPAGGIGPLHRRLRTHVVGRQGASGRTPTPIRSHLRPPASLRT